MECVPQLELCDKYWHLNTLIYLFIYLFIYLYYQLLFSFYTAPVSDISHQLEDFLVKKLDVPLEGGRLYGWQHLGRACGISKDDLKYLELAYKRDGGSPTKELLEMLGCKGKKLSDVEDVLQGLGIKIPFLSYEDM